MQQKGWSKKGRAKAVIAGAVVLLLLSGVIYLLLKGEEEGGFRYEPTVELPAEYGLIMDAPDEEDDMIFSAMLSTLAVSPDDQYRPMFILTEEGTLDDHQMHTIDQIGFSDVPFLIFTDDPESPPPATDQIEVFDVFDMGPTSLARFKGFEDVLTVASYEEALWSSTIAKHTRRVMIKGDQTYESQEEAWKELNKLGVPMDYIMVVNPRDLDNQTLGSSPGYDDFDDQFHIDALSAVAGEVAAYRDAYVLTDYEASREPIGDMDLELNSRAIGYYMALKNMTEGKKLPTYVTLVGSAAAVPQFQLPDQTSDNPENVEGDYLVSSDVVYGFLGEDPYYMDSAVGRLVNLNVQGISNQIVRTFLYHRFPSSVPIEYSLGTENVEWMEHGTSFSGYEITYKRGQVTPARFWCKDAVDEGMTYDYIGPSGLGRDIMFGDGVEPRPPEDMNNAMEASGFIAYRGHGSEYGSLYMVPYAVNRNENGVLRAEEVAQLFLPPQVGFWVACMNAKIHGSGWWKPAEPLEVERSFALNYLYGGAVISGGATEVSFSNIAQDTTSGPEDLPLPGVINPKWNDDNYEWDLNDAWFAFFWDALLNNEQERGTAGEALRWAENRYIHNPIRNDPVSPFIQDLEDPDWQGGLKGAHWKEVCMFAIYGDPAFSPHPNIPGENSYRPWVNGPDDNGEP